MCLHVICCFLELRNVILLSSSYDFRNKLHTSLHVVSVVKLISPLKLFSRINKAIKLWLFNEST